MNFTTRLQDYTVPLIGAVLLGAALIIPTSMIAYVATLILALAALIKPKQSILFLIIYFPLRSFLVEINPSLKLIGDVIIVFAFLRIVWDSRSDIKSIFRFEIYEWAFIAFLILGSVSALVSGVLLSAIIFQIRAFVITFLLLYVVKRMTITKKDIIGFLLATLAVTVVLIVQGIVEKLSARSALMPEMWINRQLSPNNKSRIYGLVNNPNVLAVFLTISGILLYYLKTLLPKNKWQWALNSLLVVLAGTWILTYSRGTWIALAIGLVVYLLLSWNWKFIVQVAAVVGLGFVLVTVPVTYATQWISSNTEIGQFDRTGPAEPDAGFAVESNRLKETFNTDTFEKSKTTGRLYVVYQGFEIFKTSPIIGTGFGTFGDSATKSYSSPIYKHYAISNNMYSDNQYIQIITQTGVIGVLLIAIFLLSMLQQFWKHRKDNKMAIPLVATLIAVYWCGFIYNIWEDKIFTMFLYVIVGAFLSTLNQKKLNH